jgi:hypothetical protein
MDGVLSLSFAELFELQLRRTLCNTYVGPVISVTAIPALEPNKLSFTFFSHKFLFDSAI